MKTCPNCGSILADNEPYCDNCGFNPDFDVGSWNDGYGRTNKKPYYHGDHIKDPNPYFINKEFDWMGLFRWQDRVCRYQKKTLRFHLIIQFFKILL